jgi:hypothetical protein
MEGHRQGLVGSEEAGFSKGVASGDEMVGLEGTIVGSEVDEGVVSRAVGEASKVEVVEEAWDTRAMASARHRMERQLDHAVEVDLMALEASAVDLDASMTVEEVVVSMVHEAVAEAIRIATVMVELVHHGTTRGNDDLMMVGVVVMMIDGISHGTEIERMGGFRWGSLWSSFSLVLPFIGFVSHPLRSCISVGW